MRRIGHHDNDGIGFLSDLFPGLADDGSASNQFRRDRAHVVKIQAMAGGLKMAGHRTPHRPEANESDIDHAPFP